MSVKVYLPDRLRFTIAKGKEFFDVEGKTVGECLDHLVGLLPRIKRSLYYDPEKKAFHSYIEVLVNEQRVDADVLGKEVKDGDGIRIRMEQN